MSNFISYYISLCLRYLHTQYTHRERQPTHSISFSKQQKFLISSGIFLPLNQFGSTCFVDSYPSISLQFIGKYLIGHCIFTTGIVKPTNSFTRTIELRLCVKKEKNTRKISGNQRRHNNHKMSHTILLVQPGSRPETRTYSDYESVNECMEGVCKIYEEHLKRRNPNTPTITYDISQLFDFLDQVIDCDIICWI